MKVLHVIDSGGLYGAEVMLLNLMDEQVAMGHEPILASIGDPGVTEKPLETEAVRRGLRVKVFRMRPGPNYPGALKVLRFARHEQVALLHSHGYKGNILFGLMPSMVRRLPMVSTIHGWTWTGGMTRMGVYEWLDSLSLGRVDRVVAVNSGMKDHPRIRNRRGLALDVVPNGIPPGGSEPGKDGPGLDQDIIRFCQQGFCIGAVGRLSPEKGFDSLLEVVAALVARGKDVRLVILGEGGLRRDLEQAVRELAMENIVLMPGYVQEARCYLPFFDLFAMPSLTEGLPMVLLEAMQAGVPIVASRVGGIPEVLQEGRCGVLVNPGSSKSLEQGVMEIMADSGAAKQRVRDARERVDNEFSSRTMAEKYLAIYRSVLGE